MGWLSRMFGVEAPAQAPQNMAGNAQGVTEASDVPPERRGLNGEYDQSGLAKRIAQAYDMNPLLADIDTVWVAQHNTGVVLKGTAPSQEKLDKLVQVARTIGATDVDVSQVQIGEARKAA